MSWERRDIKVRSTTKLKGRKNMCHEGEEISKHEVLRNYRVGRTCVMKVKRYQNMKLSGVKNGKTMCPNDEGIKD